MLRIFFATLLSLLLASCDMGPNGPEIKDGVVSETIEFSKPNQGYEGSVKLTIGFSKKMDDSNTLLAYESIRPILVEFIHLQAHKWNPPPISFAVLDTYSIPESILFCEKLGTQLAPALVRMNQRMSVCGISEMKKVKI